MRDFLLDKTEKLLKAHPMVVIFILVCCLVTLTGSMALADQKFVTKQDFQHVVKEVGKVASKVDSIDLELKEARIATIEAEVFNLERLAANGSATDRDLGRLDELRSTISKLERELSTMYEKSR